MNRTIVKTREAHDFLALVPQLVGFLPERSLVFVAFRGNRTCGAMRFNLPEPTASERVLKSIAGTLVGTICKIPDVDGLVPVVYSDEPIATVTGLPQERFAGALAARARLSGFLIRDALCVAPDGWGSYFDRDCPAGGHPLSAIATSEVHRAIPEAVRRELATLRSRADLPTVDPSMKERLGRRLARYQRLGAQADTMPELLELAGDILDPVVAAEAALGFDPQHLGLDDAAALLFLVQGPACRDQMMLQFAFGETVGRNTQALNRRYATLQRATGRSLDDIIGEEQSEGRESPHSRSTGDLMLGFGRERPDPARIEQAILVLKVLVALAPRKARPAPLCMLAWLSWALGRGSVASIFVDQALAIDRHYGMAALLNILFGTGHLPDWAFEVPPDETAPA